MDENTLRNIYNLQERLLNTVSYSLFQDESIPGKKPQNTNKCTWCYGKCTSYKSRSVVYLMIKVLEKGKTGLAGEFVNKAFWDFISPVFFSFSPCNFSNHDMPLFLFHSVKCLLKLFLTFHNFFLFLSLTN